MNWSKYQKKIFKFIDEGQGSAVVLAVAGAGKCLGLGTPILMHDGTIKPVESVEVGNALMGPDSMPRSVRSTSSGFGPPYRIVPTKGDPWVCNDAHILTLVNSVTGEVFDIPAKEYRGAELSNSSHMGGRPDQRGQFSRKL